MSLEAVVEYEYQAEQEDELDLKVGDVIANVVTAEGGWWEGELNGKKGMFPENFVKLVEKRKPAGSKKETEKQIATQRKSVKELANKFKDGVPMGAPPKKKEKKKRCKVLYDYTRENDDELDLAVGDVLDFQKQVEEGWWEGSLNGKHGVFPSNFVEMIEDGDVDSPDVPPVPAVTPPSQEKEKPPAVEKDEPFHSIKGKKVVGVGLGNIFGGGPIQLRSTAAGKKEEQQPPPRPTKPGESDPGPEAVKREKTSTLERAVVRFSYAAEQPDELSLMEGQVIRILDKHLEDDGWWKGEVNGKEGVFPDNFVELLPAEEPSKPKKPPPPSSAAKMNAYPKLPDKTIGDEEKSKPDHKKVQPPPPIGKKPLPAKPEQPLPARPIAPTVKDQKSASLKDNKTPNSSNLDNNEQEVLFDGIESSSQKLTHPTASRPKGPKKRPPSTVLNLNEAGDIKEETPPDTRTPDIRTNQTRTDKPALSHTTAPDRPLGSNSRHPAQSNHEAPSVSSPVNSLNSTNRETERNSAPPPRPPEPVQAPPTAFNTQTNKLFEQLQKELHDLKANTVSKAEFNELRAENERLRSEFETFKTQHTKKLKNVVLEVDEEKKLRLTTQVEIERVKKWMAETNV